MTDQDFQKAMLVEFAARQAGPRGTVEIMRAICYVIRNRVRAGWYDGNWIHVIEHADEAMGNPPPPRIYLDPGDRALQTLKRDIDSIYFGRISGGWVEADPAKDEQGETMETAIGTSLYWLFVDRPVTAWFQTHIIQDKTNHPERTQMGLMLMFK